MRALSRPNQENDPNSPDPFSLAEGGVWERDYFDLDFSQTTGSKVKSGAFNPLLTALKTREPVRTLTSTTKKTQNEYMLLFHAVLDCVK